MELQIPTPFVLPFRTEVDDEVQSPVPALWMVVEVNVRKQRSPVNVLVRASTVILAVVQQAADTADLGDEIQERLRLNEVVKLTIRTRDFTNIAPGGLFFELAMFACCETGLELWKVLEESSSKLAGKEAGNDGVAERSGCLKLLADRRRAES